MIKCRAKFTLLQPWLTIYFLQGVLSDCCAIFERHYDGTLWGWVFFQHKNSYKYHSRRPCTSLHSKGIEFNSIHRLPIFLFKCNMGGIYFAPALHRPCHGQIQNVIMKRKYMFFWSHHIWKLPTFVQTWVQPGKLRMKISTQGSTALTT